MNHYEIQPGDHLCYPSGHIYHHGIYCGNFYYNNDLYRNTVIHFEGKHKGGKIRGISLEEFASGGELHIVQYKPDSCNFPYIVVERAISKIGEPDYNLFGNNCEHFAHFCKTGRKVSDQMNKAIEAGGIAVGGGAAAAAMALFPEAALILPVAAILGAGFAAFGGAGLGAFGAGFAGAKLGEFVAGFLTDSSDYDSK